jgi:CO dehydrogenase nickel-insertion accessory protein CooC1
MKKAPIIMSAGSKGGVGKSLLTMALLDHYEARNPILIETDTSNPDVAKSYAETVETHPLGLDDKDGWIQLLDVIDGAEDASPIIINTAARSNTGVEKFGRIITSALEELDRSLIALFILNRSRDSVELLKEFREFLPEAKTFAVLNEHYGSREKFQIYDESNLRKDVESKAGTLKFPDLADRVADEIYQKRMTISEGIKDMPLGNRSELKRWKIEVSAMIEGALHDPD